MPGYIFNLNDMKSLQLYAANGVYGTQLSILNNEIWKTPHEGTFADYVTMKEGDNVYFFIKRKIYGIGELVNIKGECKFSNYSKACLPQEPSYEQIKDEMLWDEDLTDKNQRWICVFKPCPHFFQNGVDMDEVLSSNPKHFRMLRAFWKLSFVKIDDEENQSLKDIILKNNQDSLVKPKEGSVFKTQYNTNHERIKQKIQKGTYLLDYKAFLQSISNDEKIKHEMGLEAGILAQLSENEKTTEDIFGKWDYLSHQVIASPFKPIDYMDKMDVFGYSYIKGYSPTKSKYLIIEIKKDKATKDDIVQLLKYVDWTRSEYCFGDYSMIKSFLVASEFEEGLCDFVSEVALRKFTVGSRPAKSMEWSSVGLIKYIYSKNDRLLRFSKINS